MTAIEQGLMSCGAQNQIQIVGICEERGFCMESNKEIKQFMLKKSPAPQWLSVKGF